MITELLAIAPMIDWSNTHFRYFMRLLAPESLVYTEMQTPGAIRHKPLRALAFSPKEHPVALQLGGSDPQALADSARLAEDAGFDEINLNLGCPSDKVQAGRFGACLMAEPATASRCLEAIKQAVNIPVSAKTRIGIDDQDSYAFFRAFIQELMNAGCDKLIVHARKAWLQGLNPKQNRSIPPINYAYVYAIKEEFPNIPVTVNGNITALEDIKTHLQKVDAVMLGRLACDNPYAIALIHHALYPQIPCIEREDVLTLYLEYVLEQQTRGTPLSILLKPILNLAHGLPGARGWKQEVMQVLQGKREIMQLQESLPELVL